MMCSVAVGIRSDIKGMKKFFPPSFDHFWSFFTSSSEQAGGVGRPRMQHQWVAVRMVLGSAPFS